MSHGEKPIILVDADGVLGDFDAAVLTKLRIKHPNVVLPQRINHNILKDFPPECNSTIRELIYDYDFFSDIPLYDDALEGWDSLLRLGYDPRVCTSPLPNNNRSIEAKKEWIRDKLVPHFGANVLKLASITLDKHLIAGAALIDDRPMIKYSETAQWRHVIFSQPYNLEVATNLRLNGWRDNNMEGVLRSATR